MRKALLIATAALAPSPIATATKQNVARYVARDIDARHAGFLRQGIGDDASLFAALAAETFRQI